MSLRLFLCKEETSRLYNVLCTDFVPLQISRVALCSYTDNVTVYDELRLFNVSFDSAIEYTVHGVILQHVSKIINWAEVVNTNYNYVLSVCLLKTCAEYETADTAKSVNTNFNHLSLFKVNTKL